MPTYKVTNPQTGKVLRITGDVPPTEKELDDIFAKTSRTTPTPQPVNDGKLSFQQGDNPLMYGAAKVQEGLANNPLLSALGGIIGNLSTRRSSIGTGAGAAIGDQLSKQLKPENSGLREIKSITDLIGLNDPSKYGITPLNKPLSSQDKAESLMTGAKAAAFNEVFKQGDKLFHPIRTVSGLRNTAAEKVADTISGDKIAQAALDAAEKAPASMRQQAQKIAMEAVDKYSGKEITVADALSDKSGSWLKGFNSSGTLSKAVAGYMERAIGSGIKNEIKSIAPNIANYDTVLSALYGTKNTLWKGAKLLPWLGGVGYGLDALKRSLGN